MPSPWLAVGAETDPLERARQLQRSWERLLAEGVLGPELPPDATAGVRATIVESWRRSLATGLDPTDLLVPIEADQSEVQERWLEHPLGSVAHVLAAQLQTVTEESNSLLVITDASGLLLHIDGAEWLKERAREMNFCEGTRYSEAADGTNGIGTALAADHPIQVFAFEHFNQLHHQWMCSGAPVHDPASGQIVGAIDVSSPWKLAHPRSLELVIIAARTVERCLLDIRRDEDARLRRRYGDLLTRSTDLLVTRSGYVLEGEAATRATLIDVPDGGGEIVLGDRSLAEAEPLGAGEAYLVRRTGSRGANSPSVGALKRTERRARDLAAEQAALRQVATLVARQSSFDQLLTVVANQAARIFAVPLVHVVRYEQDGTFVVLGGFSERPSTGPGGPLGLPIGSRWSHEGAGVTELIYQAGRPARVRDYALLAGERAAEMMRSGIRSTVGSPIVVDGRLWGAMVIGSPRPGSFPEDTEARLTDFTELIAMAIANAESHAAVNRLADEQAALRRVATMVARAVSPDELFSAVSNEVGRLVGAEAAIARFEPDGSAMVVVGLTSGIPVVTIGTRWRLEDFLASAAVYRTGRPARNDHTAHRDASGTVADSLRQMAFVSTVAVPITVEGRTWGVMTVSDQRRTLPPETEERVERFTELVATAIANADSRWALGRLAEEQAALRRVATLVARAPASEELFSTVAEEVASVLDVSGVIVTRYDDDGMALTLGQAFRQDLAGAEQFLGVGTRMPRDPGSLAAQVFDTHGPARVDDFSTLPGTVGDLARAARLGSGCAGPIVVNGAVWGKLCIFSRVGVGLPAGTENRLHDFVELVATAIANYEARADLAASEARARELAEEQAALRRVATLVARGVSPEEIFSAVANEMGGLFYSLAYVGRFEPDGSAMIVLGVSDGIRGVSTGSRWELEAYMASTGVYRTGRPVRLERSDFEHASGPLAEVLREIGAVATVGAPIVVEGNLWGFVTVASVDHLPADAEQRLEKFTELLATAVANADSRAELAASRARIIAAADDARRRIERDLHDGAQQQLVTLTVALRRAEAKLPPGPSELRVDLTRVTEGLTTAVDELRELSRGIHPSILGEGGLAPALKALGRRSPVRVKLDMGFEQRLPDPVEVAAYYTVSEALTNASKHANSTRVWVSLRIEDDNLLLSIRDDGGGGADPSRGSGLTGLRDRIEAVGGKFRIESPLGSGTLIDVEIPTVRAGDANGEPAELPAQATMPRSPG